MKKSLPLWKLRKVCFLHVDWSNVYLIWSIHYFLVFTSSGPKYESNLIHFAVFASKLTRSTICYGLRNIWIDLSEYWSFYGLKLPPKISFSRNFVHFVSSNSLTIKNFSKTLVFLYFQFTWAIVHAVKKNLQKFSLSRNWYLWPLPP